MKSNLKNLYIYLTENCNLNCQHCWVNSGPSDLKASLSFTACESFLEDAVRAGLKRVILSGGEPFLNKEIWQFISFLNSNGIQVVIESNGTLVNNKIKDKLETYRPYLALSVDGISKEVHEGQRGRNTYNKVMKCLTILEDIKLPYQIIIAVSKFNLSEVDKLSEFISVNLKYCNALKINPVNSDGRAKDMQKNDMLLTYFDLQQLAEKINKLSETYSFRLLLHLNKPFLLFDQILDKFTCGGYCGIKSALSILSDGTVSVCSLGRFTDKRYTFGNVASASLSEIWDNEKLLVDLRSETYHTKLEGVCGNCIFKKSCGGSCRAASLVEYNEIYAPFPNCQQLYNQGLFPENYLIDKMANSSY